jgi:hypothetical protein
VSAASSTGWCRPRTGVSSSGEGARSLRWPQHELARHGGNFAHSTSEPRRVNRRARRAAGCEPRSRGSRGSAGRRTYRSRSPGSLRGAAIVILPTSPETNSSDSGTFPAVKVGPGSVAARPPGLVRLRPGRAAPGPMLWRSPGQRVQPDPGSVDPGFPCRTSAEGRTGRHAAAFSSGRRLLSARQFAAGRSTRWPAVPKIGGTFQSRARAADRSGR